MDLRLYLSLIILCVLCATFICVGLLLLSGWAAVLIVFNAIAVLIQLVGAMTLMDMKLSAIPAVVMVLSVGLSVCFTIHVSLVSIFDAQKFHFYKFLQLLECLQIDNNNNSKQKEEEN